MLRQALHDFFCRVGLDKTYWIAYSGGLDSHVLLALCQALRTDLALDLRAIHINHQLSPHATTWAAHCRRVCVEYDIEYVEQSLNIDLQPGDSLEEIARDKRYHVFADLLSEKGVLLTAHHQDDQAETLLLQLFRGAGLKGLAAMPESRVLGRGYHARPLLGLTRADLSQFAIQHRLTWVEDESNANTALTRNFIRHEVLPILTSRWPALTSVLARSAAHCAESQALLEEYSVDLLNQSKGSRENTLSVARLLKRKAAERRLILRAWIQSFGFQLPDTKTLRIISTELLNAAPDRKPLVCWDDVEMRRYRDDLYIMSRLAAHDPAATIIWDLDQPLMLPGIGRFTAVPVKGRGMRVSDKQLTLRFRQGGEIAALPRRGRHTLKNLFQEWDVPAWLRERIPLVYIGDKLVSAIGYFIDPEACAGVDDEGYELQWEAILSK